MTAQAPTFHSVDHIAGLILNYCKCCWVQYGTEGRESLRTWISENCEEFREMQIVRHAKYVGTMIGPDGHLHRFAAPRKNSSSTCWKSMHLPRAWLSDCATSRSMRFLCWVLAPYARLIRQASRQRTMPFSVQQQARTTLYRLPFLELDPYVVLVLIWWVFTPSALRLAIELRHARPRFVKALRNYIRLVDTIALPFSVFLTSGRENLLFFLWPLALRMLLILFVVWTVMIHLMKFQKKKKQKVATGLLLDELHRQDFAGPLSSRGSRFLGPISRYCVADILSHMKLVSRASRPGLIVGFLRILWNGLCTAQRFHAEEDDHTCRVGCPNEPDSLTHYNECPQLYNNFTSFWRHATVLPQRNHFLHELITRVFLRSLQYGIVVYAHHQHPAKALRILEILVIAWKEGFALWRPPLLPTPTHIR